jgi:hypothetical protein
MTWNEIDWTALERLRAGFLHGAAAEGAYWQNARDLASYDFTYGERIGWKWDAVLTELKLRGWRPTAGESVLDWGCGSGIAGRRVIGAFSPTRFARLRVWDHSPLAMDFAADAAARAFPGLDVAAATPDLLQGDDAIGLLVISHVLNELPPAVLVELRALCARARAIIWVEPGTHGVSRQLSALRDELRATFAIIAPCTHAKACPILLPENSRDWCHHFAPPPSEIFAQPDWVKFGQRAGIDLRSLPYCFFALDRTWNESRPSHFPAPADGENSAVPPDAPLSRIIGRPEHFKPYARFLNCDASGLAELTLPKRADPALYKQLDRTKAPLVYRWRRSGDEVLGGEPLDKPTSILPT